MLQWGMPQLNMQSFMPFNPCNYFAMPFIQPMANPFFSSIFLPPFNNFQRPLTNFNSFGSGNYNLCTQAQQYNFLNSGLTNPKPQGATSTIAELWNEGTQTIKKYVKKGYNYAKKTYRSVKQSVKELLEKAGYNAEKGHKLAQEAQKGAAGRFKGKCATYVKRAIEKAGLGKYIHGVNGCDMARVYGQNTNFKKVSAKDVNVKDLPEGCILCYDGGKSGHHKLYGHTGITLGNGTEVSDGLTRNPKEASYILIPV